LGGALAAVRLGREYWKFWAASTVSNGGDGVMLAAGPLLAAALTRDPVLVAGLTFAQRLPWLLFTLVSGVLVDRLDRRRLMAAVGVARAIAVGLLGAAVLLDAATIPLLYAVLFAMGVAETLFDNAAIAVVPAVVPAGSLDKANSRMFGAQMVAQDMAAPPLGGLLFATVAAAPFLLDAVALLVAAALLLTMRGSFRAELPEGIVRGTIRAEIVEGARWLWGHRLLRVLAISIGLMNLTLSAAMAILVLYAQERLGLGPVGYGLLFTAIAVGGIAMSLVAERAIAWLGQGTAMRVGLIVEASTHVVLALSRSPIVVAVTLAVFGAHAIVWNTLSTSLRQQLVPPSLIGRVNSVYMLFSAGAWAIGAVLGGLLASAFGLTSPFWFAFAGVAALTVAAWRTLGTVAQARAALAQP
jgi:MFS family permease